jgi:hypothetical protein
MSFCRSSIQWKRITHNIPNQVRQDPFSHLCDTCQSQTLYLIKIQKICQHHLSTRFSRPCHYNWSIHCQKISLQLKNQLGYLLPLHTFLLPWFKYLSLASLPFSSPLISCSRLYHDWSLPPLFKKQISPLFLSSRSFQSHLT